MGKASFVILSCICFFCCFLAYDDIIYISDITRLTGNLSMFIIVVASFLALWLDQYIPAKPFRYVFFAFIGSALLIILPLWEFNQFTRIFFLISCAFTSFQLTLQFLQVFHFEFHRLLTIGMIFLFGVLFAGERVLHHYLRSHYCTDKWYQSIAFYASIANIISSVFCRPIVSVEALKWVIPDLQTFLMSTYFWTLAPFALPFCDMLMPSAFYYRRLPDYCIKIIDASFTYSILTAGPILAILNIWIPAKFLTGMGSALAAVILLILMLYTTLNYQVIAILFGLYGALGGMCATCYALVAFVAPVKFSFSGLMFVIGIFRLICSLDPQNDLKKCYMIAASCVCAIGTLISAFIDKKTMEPFLMTYVQLKPELISEISEA